MEQEQDFIMKPKVDFCFKELMEDAEVRKGFIAAVLGVAPEDIGKTTLLPTHLGRQREDDKLGILDVRVCLNDRTQMDMEIQVASFKYWQERSLFYLSKMYADQIDAGDGYGALGKCIHVGILDFTLFSGEKEYYSKFHIREDTRHKLYTDKLEIQILELPKLSRYEYPENELLDWARFINAEQKKEMEAVAEKNRYVNKAYEKLVNISADEEKRLEYEAREKAIRDHNHLISVNRSEGREEGRIEGRIEAKAESVLEVLEEFGTVPEQLRTVILSQTDMDTLKHWLKLAVRADSMEEFAEKIEEK